MSSLIEPGHSDAAVAAAVQLLKVKTLTSAMKSDDNVPRKLSEATAETASVTPKKRGRGRPKGRKTTRHPQLQRPKRPLSAYNLFFRDERNKIVENNVNEVAEGGLSQSKYAATGKLKFADLARTVGPRWKLIDEKTKKHYEARASIEMSKYKEAMAVYNKQLEEITKLEQQKVKKDEDVAANAATDDDEQKKRKRDEDTKRTIKPPRKLTGKRSLEVAATATTPNIKINKVHQEEIDFVAHHASSAAKEAIQDMNHSLRLPLRKRRFEPAADEYGNSTASLSSLSTHPDEEVAIAASRIPRAIGGDEAMSSLNVPSSLQERRSSVSQLLNQQMELRRQTMNATAAAAATASLRNHSLSTDASAAALHSLSSLNSSCYQAQGLSNLSSSFAQPPPMQSDMADIILKRAIELEAAKRLVEERQQQLNHDMAVEAALARRQRLVEEQQSQTVNLMLRLQQEREHLQNRFYHN